MQKIQQFIPITMAKNLLLDLVGKIKDSDGAIAITINEAPEAVLISQVGCISCTTTSVSSNA